MRHAVTKLTQSSEYLFWLPASEALQLNDNSFLVGQDGWADGQLGNYYDSRVVLYDSRMIGDLFQEELLGRSQLLGKMQQLADYDAEQLRLQLIDIETKTPQNVVVLTHIPPFKEVCLHEGKN